MPENIAVPTLGHDYSLIANAESPFGFIPFMSPTPTPDSTVRVRYWEMPPEMKPVQTEFEFPPIIIDKWEDLNTSSHMRPYLTAESLQQRLDLAERALRMCLHKFDAIAFQGMSGAFLGPPLAMRLHKGMILVRKDCDDSHSGLSFEGVKSCSQYVIVDDFASTKNTIRHIVTTIYKHMGPEVNCAGLIQVEYLNENILRDIAIGICDPFEYTKDVNEILANLKCGIEP
jgi:adenine/guanine phosphoribosyltransferase-like PRPP-binding protein